MGFWSHLPNRDYSNDGWTIVGGAGSLWATWNNDTDTLYAQCPGYKGYGACLFPVDITNVPDGAVITSITVKLRCATGTGTPPSGVPASITVHTSCTDDTSRFTARTIYPTSVITTYEVATYQRDCLGLIWDIERINKLICRVFSYVGIFDLIRCYKFYVDIKYRVRPTITVDAPSGTVYTPSPTISWTYRQTDGDPQAKVKYRLFTSVQQADPAFDPARSICVYEAELNGDVSSVVLPTSIDPDSYWVYVRSTSSFGAKSLWVGRQFQVSGPAPGPPGVPDPTGTVAPGTGIIAVVPDSQAGSATLALNDTSNLLSVQAADAETTTDQSEMTATNCAIARDTSIAFPGGQGSWKMTATALGTMTATSSWTEVAPNSPVTARCQFITAVTGRSCQIRIQYYDANFTSISTTTSATITDATSTWTEAVVAGTTPATAVYAKVSFDVLSAAASEVHNIDHLGLMYGTQSAWSDGGHASRNLLSHWYSTAEGTALNGESWLGSAGTTVATATPPGTGGSGATCNKLTYAGLTPSLGLRAAGTVFTTPTTGTDYTLNKPVGVATGDLMVAYVSSTKNATITPPAGWTLVDSSIAIEDGTADTALWVLKRTAGGSEPTTWAGTVSASSARRAAVVVAYSGAADASLQFIAEGQNSTTNNLPAYVTTPSVYNTDPNAWRASAFAFNNNVTGGTCTANINPPNTIPAITFVAAGSAWTTTNLGSSYTINKPAGVVSGDLMIAQVSVSASSASITAPTGWTVVNQAGGPNGPIRTAVLKRTAGASEPTSWTGSFSGTVSPVPVGASRVVAYRNAADASLQFTNNNMSESEGGTDTITTPAVNNNNSSGWRVVAFAGDGDHADSWSTADNAERYDTTVNLTTGAGQTNSITISLDDSNGAIGSGNYSKTATMSEPFYSATAWIGMIKPLSAAPAAGVNETARAGATGTTIGASNPWLTLGAYDSNGVVATGNQSVTGAYTPGSGTGFQSGAGWIGIIKPATPVRAGQAGATMATTVDITSIDDVVVSTLSGMQCAATAAFIGSTAGTPLITANFYRANQLISSATAQGTSFGTGTWIKSGAVFDVPAGTTRMSLGVAVTDRAVNDIVYFDRVSLALGNETVFRPGTYRAANPIWAAPLIQYADDDGTGYGPWTTLPGTISNPPSYDGLSGSVSYTDHTVVPLTNRKYRARTVSYGLAGDQFVSTWGPDSSEFSFVADNWWLKDIRNPDSNLQLKVKYDAVSIGTTNTATTFQPLGEDLPIVLTEGYKGDTFTLTLIPVGQLDYANLKKLLKSGRTLFLQSDVDNAWWVRPVGDIGADILPTSQRQSTPLREVKVTFVQVAAEL